MDEDVQTNPSPIMRRIFGLPVIVWIGIAAVIAFIWFSRRNSSSGGGGLLGGSGGDTSSGGGGSATSGNTRIDKGAVSITVTQGNKGQPKPPMRHKKSFVAVPDVRGMRYPAAAKELHHEGLKSHRAEPYVGKVTKEIPGEGAKVKRGSIVTLAGEKKPKRGGGE